MNKNLPRRWKKIPTQLICIQPDTYIDQQLVSTKIKQINNKNKKHLGTNHVHRNNPRWLLDCGESPNSCTALGLLTSTPVYLSTGIFKEPDRLEKKGGQAIVWVLSGFSKVVPIAKQIDKLVTPLFLYC